MRGASASEKTDELIKVLKILGERVAILRRVDIHVAELVVQKCAVVEVQILCRKQGVEAWNRVSCKISRIHHVVQSCIVSGVLYHVLIPSARGAKLLRIDNVVLITTALRLVGKNGGKNILKKLRVSYAALLKGVETVETLIERKQLVDEDQRRELLRTICCGRSTVKRTNGLGLL